VSLSECPGASQATLRIYGAIACRSFKDAPASVIDDYKRLMHLADYQSYVPQENETALKINIT